jgi:hypothetical protein
MCRTQPELLRGFDVPEACPFDVTVDDLPAKPGVGICPKTGAQCDEWSGSLCEAKFPAGCCLSTAARWLADPQAECPLDNAVTTGR